MSFSKVYSAQTTLLKPHIIDIEVDLSRGLHAFSIVGLPDKAVEESRDRIAAAVKNSGFVSPKSKNQKVVISLAPADIKKEGPSFDLGIALAYLLAAGNIQFKPDRRLFLGELSLDGELRSVKGVLPLVVEAKRQGFKEVFVPLTNTREAALIGDIKIFGARTLKGVLEHLNEEAPAKDRVVIQPSPRTAIVPRRPLHTVDFKDVRGQESAKRGLEIAAAGGHNVAMFGPPGTGKTMLARAFCGLLPALDFDDVLTVTSIHSVAGTLQNDLVTHPPFRSPHHTSSYVSLVGGGTTPKPGEITLAHKGVLFLDEFPEFDRRVIEALRQPLEDRVVSVSRARASATFPANVILVAAMNPCPCGNWGSGKACVCTPSNLERYRRKMSGPIVDRIDLWVEVGSVPHEKLSAKESSAEESTVIEKRVARAREIQRKRFANTRRVHTNSDMGVKELKTFVQLPNEISETLNAAAKRLGLSARGYHRVIKLARTIADLHESNDVETPHLLEALQYRPKQSAVGI